MNTTYIFIKYLFIVLIVITYAWAQTNSFPHEIHISEMSCLDCHTKNKNGTPQNPEQSVCMNCHDEDITLPSRMNQSISQLSQIDFSHEVHQNQSCDSCHRLSDTIMKKPDKTNCFSCHTQQSTAFQCKSCHKDHPIKPLYHTKEWQIHHRFNNIPQSLHGYQCDACHGHDACISCHKRTAPIWHTGFFKFQGHGIRADMNRQSCETCHENQFCIRCHRTTKPKNHRGRWISTHGRAIPGGFGGQIGGCGTCHTPTTCMQCHAKQLR